MKTIPDSLDQTNRIDELLEEFVKRVRNGESISADEFASQHPALERQLRELLSVVGLLDRAPSQTVDSGSPSQTAQVALEIPGYKILRILGQGGMGVVYEAEDLGLARRIALKTLRPSSSGNDSHRERFFREARAAGRLHHTNIVTVHEVSEHQGVCYYTMQIVDGPAVDQLILLLRSTKSESDEHSQYGALVKCFNPQRIATAAARLGAQIAAALAFAHERGILHRDVKPANILLDQQGTAWITDFGLAKDEGGDDVDLTGTNDLLGTLRYMDPERFNGVCDARSDVYGLGLTLYELLTLESPFSTKDRVSLLNAIRNETLMPLRKRNPDVPRDLAIIIDKAIEKEPRHRYQSAKDLEADLNRFLLGEPITARKVHKLERLRMWCKRNPALASVTILLNGVLLATAIGSAIAAFELNARTNEANRARAKALLANETAIAKAEEARQQTVIALRNELASKQVSDFLSTMIRGADPSGLFTGHSSPQSRVDRSTTAFEWISRSTRILDEVDFSQNPLVEAQLRDTLGVALTGQMQMDEAQPQLEQALSLRTNNLSTPHEDIAESIYHLGVFHFYCGDTDRAADMFRRSLQMRKDVVTRGGMVSGMANENENRLSLDISRNQAALGLALAYSVRKHVDEAEQHLRVSLASRIALLGPKHVEVAYCHVALASILARSMRHEEAIKEVSLAEQILSQEHGDQRLTEVFVLYSQGTAFQSAKLMDLAIACFSQAQTKMKEVFGPMHPLTVYARGEIAGVLERSGKMLEAETIYRDVIAFNEKSMPGRPFVGHSYEALGHCYSSQDRREEAREMFAKALAIYEQTMDPENPRIAMCNMYIGQQITVREGFREALIYLNRARQILLKKDRDTYGGTFLPMLTHTAYIITRLEDDDAYLELVEDCLAYAEGETNPTLLFHVLDCCTRWKISDDQANKLVVHSRTWLDQSKNPADQAEASHFHGRALYFAGQFEEAHAFLKLSPQSTERLFQTEMFTCMCLNELGKTDDARRRLMVAIESILPKLHEPRAIRLRTLIGRPVTSDDPLATTPPLCVFDWDQEMYARQAYHVVTNVVP